MSENYRDIGDPLDCLAEECAEVIQAIMKIKRFGYIGKNPHRPDATNISDLLVEISDVEYRIKQVKEKLAIVKE